MKSYYFVIFVLLSFSSNAAWQTYQNDLGNSGNANGTGYFPVATSNFSIDFGMDFQPLADDIDMNGQKEIIIFSNNSLIIFNPQLEIISQAKIGTILGQPELFNFDNDSANEIIFNARQGSADYFFAYQLNNSNLQQEFNITLSHEANFSGIKCFKFNGTSYCTFKDEFNYVNIVNMSSRINSYYNTSAYEEVRQTVPAIGDIDNDGRYEAVWWFNENNASGYGFLVFDLINRSLETNFNNSGIVDNIFSPLILGPSLFHQLFELKGQPVLVDLNNDGLLEIAASAFYDDSFNQDSRTDWFSELFVYEYNGTKLFSKCEAPTVINSGCNDGGSSSNKWEGTNPFVLDYNKDGADDICFIKDVKRSTGAIVFDYLALNCYNYSGDEIAKVNLTDKSSSMDTSILADMNGDGEKEIITMTKVYLLNGTSIFSYNLDMFNPIAVDLDGNNGLDLLWTREGQTKVFLDNINYTMDLSISDIIFSKLNETHVNVSAAVKNTGQVAIDNAKVAIYNDETLESKNFTFSIMRNANLTLSSALELKKGQKALSSIDPDNEINESDEGNNDLIKEFFDVPYVYVSWSADDSLNFVMNGVKDYIKDNLVSGYYTNDESKADFIVLLRKFHSLNEYDKSYTRNRHGWGFDSYSTIDYFDESHDAPYAGLVGAYKRNGRNYIAIYGNRIDGDLAAAKEFIKNQAELLANEGYAVVIGNENPEALKIYDYLHQPSNLAYYDENTIGFLGVVKNALDGKMFAATDKNVTASNGISLRLRNLKPDFSDDYFEYLNSTGIPTELPVVMAHGLFSNLSTWEGAGGEISNTGRDTWLIEITGGPGQDCDSCIDYSFYNLTDIFVPALLNGVLNFTGKDKLQYVGFSNGCRAALDSLERGKFDSNKVETFVAVGCPGAFEELSVIDSGIALVDDVTINNLQNKNKHHVNIGDLLKTGLLNKNVISNNENGKISVELWKKYLNFMSSSNDNQPGNITVPKFGVIGGSGFLYSDGIVTIVDEDSIYSKVILRNSNILPSIKQSFLIFAVHSNLDDRQVSKDLISRIVNNKELTFLQKTINLRNQSEVVG